MEYLINLYAFCLPLIIFSFWFLIGYATLSLLRTQRNIMQNLLLAPAIGVSVTLLPIFWLNRLGFPIHGFAHILFFCLLFLSVLVLWKRKVIFPWRYYAPFAFIFLLALFLTGRPLIAYGFNWVSFSNEDMLNYCLGALRLINHGFFDTPTLSNLMQGKDYSLFYWFDHVTNLVRCGSEMLLAWVSAVTHLTTLEAFMPLILSFHLILISTTGAMVSLPSCKRFVPISACLLLSFSPLTSLGTLYQLIAQVSGLSLLIASAILLLKAHPIHAKFSILRSSVLNAIVFSAFMIIYPELTPFLITAFIFYYVANYLHGWRLTKKLASSLLCTCLFVILILNIQLPLMLLFLSIQFYFGASYANATMFHYFFEPTGIANLWGFLPLTIYQFANPIIFLSSLLSILSIIATIYLILRHIFIAAIFTLIMAGVGLLLFINQSGFGLFKLAMFMQPFLLSVVGITLSFWFTRSRLKYLLLFAILLLGLPSFNFYIDRSKGATPGTFTEIAYASASQLNQEFLSAISQLPADAILLTDDFNVSLFKLEAALSGNHRLILLMAPPKFMYFMSNAHTQKYFFKKNPTLMDQFFSKALFLNKSIPLVKACQILSVPMNFNLLKITSPKLSFIPVPACENNSDCSAKAILVADSPIRSTLNKRHYLSSSGNFTFEPYNKVKNHLIFTDSSLGRIYWAIYYYDFGPAKSFYNLENDMFYPQKPIQAMGQYLLFRVINPSKQFRLCMNITNTFDGNSYNKLPSPTVIGNNRMVIPTIGRGSARVFSKPFSAQTINGLSYIALDNLETTINDNVFMQKIKNDPRKIVTYAREISLLSEDEYKKLNPPTYLKHFPHDLDNADLEYSGFYEDGWISENSYCKLKLSDTKDPLIVRGIIPKINAAFLSSDLTILVEGKKIFHHTLYPGKFDIKIPVNDVNIGNKKIELHFSKTQQLPGGDNRPSAAFLNFIGFGENTLSLNPPSVVQQFPQDIENPDLDCEGVYKDGWVINNAYFILKNPAITSNLVIKGMLPKLDKNFKEATLTVMVDGQKTYQEKMIARKFSIKIPMQNERTGRKKIELVFDKQQQLPPGDGRFVAALIKFIGFI